MTLAAVKATEKINPTQFNQDVEQALLAIALRNPELMLDYVQDKDFYLADHVLISRCIREIYEEGSACDPVTVSARVAQIGNKDLFEYLSELYTLEPPAGSAEDYAKIIAGHAFSRRVSMLSTQMRQVGESNHDPESKRDHIESLISQLDDTMPARHETVSAAEGARQMAEIVESIAENGGNAVNTHFHDLDGILSGLLPGDMVVVAGRPAMGKTAFALNIAKNVAEFEQKGVAVFSMEMTASQLGGRLVCDIASIDSIRLRSGNLTESEWEDYNRAAENLEKLPIRIDDRPGLNIQQMKTSLRKMVRSGFELGLIVIDYLQLMTASGDKRYEQVTNISGQIKALAKTFEVPVIVLSQLSRDVEKRADKRPMPSDLRESGSIEQDADIIIFLYRDEVYYPDSPNKGLAEALVPKHRSGSPGVAILGFQGKYTRFSNKQTIPHDDYSVELP